MKMLWIKVALMFCFIQVGKADTNSCHYTRYVSAFIPGLVSIEDATIYFSELSLAKDACDLLGDNCTGIVLLLNHQPRTYILASSNLLRFSPDAMSWRKECPGGCEFRLGTDYVRRRRFYRRVCPPLAVSQDATWSQWSPWGQCSQSCGTLGEQLRYRECQAAATLQRCSGYRYQRRVCNYARQCPSTLSDVFGVFGTEGFQFAGSTPVYSTCIRTEQGDKAPCGGDQDGITREKCIEQFDCCYANDTTFSLFGGPRCFQPRRFIGSSGLIGWSVWSPWTVCSRSCENGTRSRSRICTGSIPSSADCVGTDQQTEVCTLGTCPCVVNPCHNEGVCLPDNRIARGYRCDCPSRFIGRHCDYGAPNLSCGNDSITVSFDRRVIPDEGLIDDVRYIHFQGQESGQCFARPSQDGRQYVLSIPPPIDSSCGSVVNITGEEYTIRNKVLWRLTDQSASSTVVLLDLTCVYDKQPNMTSALGFGIQPIVRTLSTKTVRSSFHVDMRLYRSVDFTPNSLITEAPTIAEGEILYVSVDLRTISITNPENEVLVLDRCYATDTTEDRAPVYDFITDGCSTNPSFTTILENGQSASGRWGFRVFEWAALSQTSDVFIVCRIFVCDAGYESCLPSCGGSVSPTQSPGGDGEPELTDAQAALIQDLLNSLVTDPGSNNTSANRRKKRETNDYVTDDVRQAKMSNNHRGRVNDGKRSHLLVSKRVKMVRPVADDGLKDVMMMKNFKMTSTNSVMTSSSQKEDSFACGVTSMIVVGSGSVIVYVIISFLVKKMTANCYK